MVQILRRLSVVCVAPKEHFPKNIGEGKSYPVVGVVENVIRVDEEGKMSAAGKKVKNVVRFCVINDDGKFQQIADFNCHVSIIDAAKN